MFNCRRFPGFSRRILLFVCQCLIKKIFFRSNSHSSSKKDKDSRKRTSSSVKLDKLEGPAAKMARAIGSDPSKEAKFLEESFKKKDDRKIVKPRLLPQTDSNSK